MVRIEEDTTYEVYLTKRELERINTGGIVKVEINGSTVEFGGEPDASDDWE